jgi:hypothetical protein
MVTRIHVISMFLALLLAVWDTRPVMAQGRAQAARSAADFLIERFGPQAARQGVAALAQRIESMAVRFGDDVFVAIKKCGPRFFEIVEAAGAANATRAVRLMAEFGEAGVVWVLSRPTALKLVAQHGEEVAAVLVRHSGGICEKVIEQGGGPAVKALQAVGPQSGRRLAMMAADGELAQIARTPEVLGVIAQYGDRAMEFIYKNRFLLASSAVLGAFCSNPEPFLSGVRDITKIAADSAVKPLADVPGQVATEAARQINWNVIVIVILVLAAGLAAGVFFLPRWRQHFDARFGGRDVSVPKRPAKLAPQRPAHTPSANGSPKRQNPNFNTDLDRNNRR